MASAGCVPTVTISTDSRRGSRKYMEDVVKLTETRDGRIFLIICDGHGGRRAADFASKRLVELVQLFKPDEWDLHKAIATASQEWDKLCMKKLNIRVFPTSVEKRQEAFAQCNREVYYGEGWHSGTTVVCVLLDVFQKRGMMANLGDSRGMWKDTGKERSRLRSTRDHVPKKNDLGPLGGDVVQQENDVPRINGDLAVGRALGDNSEDLMGTVLHEPVVREFRWVDGPLRVVLATDGVWDVLTNSRAMSLQDAETIVNEAMVAGTEDNVTAGVIQIDYPETQRRTYLKMYSSTT